MKRINIYTEKQYIELGLTNFPHFKEKWKSHIAPIIDWGNLEKAIQSSGNYTKVIGLKPDKNFLMGCHIPVYIQDELCSSQLYSPRYRVKELLRLIKKSPKLAEEWPKVYDSYIGIYETKLTIPAVWTGKILLILDGTHRLIGVMQDNVLFEKTEIAIEVLDLTFNFYRPERYFVDLLYYINNKP